MVAGHKAQLACLVEDEQNDNCNGHKEREKLCNGSDGVGSEVEGLFAEVHENRANSSHNCVVEEITVVKIIDEADRGNCDNSTDHNGKSVGGSLYKLEGSEESEEASCDEKKHAGAEYLFGIVLFFDLLIDEESSSGKKKHAGNDSKVRQNVYNELSFGVHINIVEIYHAENCCNRCTEKEHQAVDGKFACLITLFVVFSLRVTQFIHLINLCHTVAED